jgi:hypothetical protein
MMWGQARASRRVMGVDTHMIAGVCACLTFTSDDSHLTIKTIPHYAGALGMRLLTQAVRLHSQTNRSALG